MKRYYVYVLFSAAHNKYYYGFTENLERRLTEHNSGKSKFTSAFLPWKLVYYEVVQGTDAARTREKYFKSAAGRKYLQKNFHGEKASSPPAISAVGQGFQYGLPDSE